MIRLGSNSWLWIPRAGELLMLNYFQLLYLHFNCIRSSQKVKSCLVIFQSKGKRGSISDFNFWRFFFIFFLLHFFKIRFASFARTCYKSGVTSWILQCGFPSCAPNLWSPLLQCPSGAPICISSSATTGVGSANREMGETFKSDKTLWKFWMP